MEKGEHEPRLEIAQSELEGFTTRVMNLVGNGAESREFPVRDQGDEKVVRLTSTGSRETQDLYTTMTIRDKGAINGSYPFEKLLIDVDDGRFTITHRQGSLVEGEHGELIDPSMQLQQAHGDPAIREENIDRIQAHVADIMHEKAVMGEPIDEFIRMGSVLGEIERQQTSVRGKLTSVIRRIMPPRGQEAA